MKKDNVKVSIVTPSFNQAEFLEQTITSVLDQGYPNLEYLLVDGASTDGSQDIIHNYSHKLDWWVSEPDKGQAEAINKGLARASGEIVAWLNSDDIYLPGAIDQVAAIFKNSPEVGLVYGDVMAIDEKGETINHLHYGDWSIEDLVAFQVIGQPSVFIRRSILEQAGYLDISYHFLLDHHLWLRLAQLSQIRHISVPLSAARFHTESKNVARAAEFGKEVYRILEWMPTQPALGDILAKNRNQIQAGAHRLSAFYLLDGGDALGSIREYFHSFSQHPQTVLRDWKHLSLAFLSLFGLNRLGYVYRKIRKTLIGRK